MRFPIFLSIRDKATRLPGKSFVDVAGQPAVEQLIARLKGAYRASGIIICTSVHPDDAVFEPVAARHGLGCFRGSEDDKLERYRAAAEQVGAEFIVVVDGDDLLCDPGQIDRIIAAYEASTATDAPLDYIIVDELPVGVTGFGVRVEALERVCEIKKESDTEVWGGYFANSGLFNCAFLQPDNELTRRPDLRLTLDYPEDLAVFRAVFENFRDRSFDLDDVVSYLDDNPKVSAINAEVQQKYLAHLAEAAPVRLADGETA